MTFITKKKKSKPKSSYNCRNLQSASVSGLSCVPQDCHETTNPDSKLMTKTYQFGYSQANWNHCIKILHHSSRQQHGLSWYGRNLHKSDS